MLSPTAIAHRGFLPLKLYWRHLLPQGRAKAQEWKQRTTHTEALKSELCKLPQAGQQMQKGKDLQKLGPPPSDVGVWGGDIAPKRCS